MHEIPAHERLIVALDLPSRAEALAVVEELGDAVSFYKVGLELFSAEGLPVIRALRDQGKQVFLDLKLFDIGETVKRTSSVIARQDVQFLTVQGDKPVVRAAVEGRGDSSLKIMAVTVLTSLDAQDMSDIGYRGSVEQVAQHRAAHAIQAGCDGLIASAHEVRALKAGSRAGLLVITPGIRPAGAAGNDQKRIATPGFALGEGSDYLVVGRPVTAAPDRRAAAEAIQQEIRDALRGLAGAAA